MSQSKESPFISSDAQIEGNSVVVEFRRESGEEFLQLDLVVSLMKEGSLVAKTDRALSFMEGEKFRKIRTKPIEGSGKWVMLVKLLRPHELVHERKVAIAAENGEITRLAMRNE